MIYFCMPLKALFPRNLLCLRNLALSHLSHHALTVIVQNKYVMLYGSPIIAKLYVNKETTCKLMCQSFPLTL